MLAFNYIERINAFSLSLSGQSFECLFQESYPSHERLIEISIGKTQSDLVRALRMHTSALNNITCGKVPTYWRRINWFQFRKRKSKRTKIQILWDIESFRYHIIHSRGNICLKSNSIGNILLWLSRYTLINAEMSRIEEQKI